VSSVQITLAGAEPALQQVDIRPLVGDEASIYFPLRDEILKSGDGHFFSDSYTRERKLLTRNSNATGAPERTSIASWAHLPMGHWSAS